MSKTHNSYRAEVGLRNGSTTPNLTSWPICEMMSLPAATTAEYGKEVFNMKITAPKNAPVASLLDLQNRVNGLETGISAILQHLQGGAPSRGLAGPVSVPAAAPAAPKKPGPGRPPKDATRPADADEAIGPFWALMTDPQTRIAVYHRQSDGEASGWEISHPSLKRKGYVPFPTK